MFWVSLNLTLLNLLCRRAVKLLSKEITLFPDRAFILVGKGKTDTGFKFRKFRGGDLVYIIAHIIGWTMIMLGKMGRPCGLPAIGKTCR